MSATERILKFVMLHSVLNEEDCVARITLIKPASGVFRVTMVTDIISFSKTLQNRYESTFLTEAGGKANLRVLEAELRKQKGFHSIGECPVCYSPPKEENFSKGAVGGRQRRFSLEDN